MKRIKTAVIGGSGFYCLEELTSLEERRIQTPFGTPSDKILTGRIGDHPVAFLSRHGTGHRLNPSEVNYRANLFALKTLGVENLISCTAVGSLREELEPTHLVIPDQYYDNTFKREKTFFEEGVVAHVSMAQPTCPQLSSMAGDTAEELGIPTHRGGVYFCMEGPQFSSLAESRTYRKLGYSIIGMTQAIEAKLARELEMCFLPLAWVTDYDCWHESADSVTVEMIVGNLQKNVRRARRLIVSLVHKLRSTATGICSCHSALKDALITDPAQIHPETAQKLFPILEKYLS